MPTKHYSIDDTILFFSNEYMKNKTLVILLIFIGFGAGLCIHFYFQEGQPKKIQTLPSEEQRQQQEMIQKMQMMQRYEEQKRNSQ